MYKTLGTRVRSYLLVALNTPPSLPPSLPPSQTTLSQLHSVTHKIKGAKANVSLIQTDAATAMATELQARLDRVLRWWEPLEGRLRHRLAQLRYEKKQMELIESLQEAVEELDGQPKALVLPAEIEEHHSAIMVGRRVRARGRGDECRHVHVCAVDREIFFVKSASWLACTCTHEN